MHSDEIIKKDKQYLMKTYARNPVAIERGEGARVYSPEGREYIDFTSGIGVASLGYSHPLWVGAVAKQAALLGHISNLFYTEPGTKVAETLCRASDMSRIFFGNSGAEANEGAIKLARKYSFDKYPGRDRAVILTLTQSFHGRTITTLSATGQEHFHQFFTPFTQGFRYIRPDLDALREALRDDVCALMIEVIQGEGGVLPLDPKFAREAARLAAERDVLLIVDEVQTGIGRTGRLFAYEHYGLSPDIVTVAKGLGGGLPIGAVLCTEKCADVLGPGTHGSTFGANPVACAAANAVLSVVCDNLFLSEVAAKGAYIRRQIEGMGYPFLGPTRGMGLMIGVPVRGGQSHKALCGKLVDAGLLSLTAGEDALRFLPPLTITYEEIDRGLAIFKTVMDGVQAEKVTG